MKLILEKWEDGAQHCYKETERHFKQAEKSRSIQLTKIDHATLNYECNLDCMEEGTYMVFDLKK
jgi:hypothetical protein